MTETNDADIAVLAERAWNECKKEREQRVIFGLGKVINSKRNYDYSNYSFHSKSSSIDIVACQSERWPSLGGDQLEAIWAKHVFNLGEKSFPANIFDSAPLTFISENANGICSMKYDRTDGLEISASSEKSKSSQKNIALFNSPLGTLNYSMVSVCAPLAPNRLYWGIHWSGSGSTSHKIEDIYHSFNYLDAFVLPYFAETNLRGTSEVLQNAAKSFLRSAATEKDFLGNVPHVTYQSLARRLHTNTGYKFTSSNLSRFLVNETSTSGTVHDLVHAYFLESKGSEPAYEHMKQMPSIMLWWLKKPIDDSEQRVRHRRNRTSPRHNTVPKIFHKNGVKRPVKKTRPLRIVERDTLIIQGKTLQEIADVDKTSRENIHQYIKRTNQYETWRDARERASAAREEAPTAQKKAYQELGCILNAVFLAKAKQAGWAYEEAAKYQFRVKNYSTNISFERVVAFFEKYQNAIQKGERVNLHELGKVADLSAMTAHVILKKMNLPNFNPEKKRLEPTQVNALKRASTLEHLSKHDIAYFVGTTRDTVDNHLGERTVKYQHPPSYAKSSQIYEAIDAGFTEEETAEYVEISKAVVKRALQQRPEREPKIIEALKIIYPDTGITTPYLPKEISK